MAVELANESSAENVLVDFEQLASLVCLDHFAAVPAISLLLVDDEQMACLNRRWLAHEGTTDVLSFPASEPTMALGADDLLGDIAISWQVAVDRSATMPPPWTACCELALYFVHGLLHLCGHDDTSPDQRAAMQGLEDRYLGAAGYPPVPREE